MRLEHNSISRLVVCLVGRDKWTEIGDKVRFRDRNRNRGKFNEFICLTAIHILKIIIRLDDIAF